MKIDKKQSLKNKIGVVLATFVLSSTLMTSNALADNYNYTDEQTKVDFIYDDDHTGRMGLVDEGSFKLVIIANLESGDYVVISLEQLDEILEHQSGDILIIDDKEFSRESVLSARNSLKEKYPKREKIGQQYVNATLMIFGVPCLIAISVKVISGLRIFIYNIRRGFREDKSRRKFTKYVKIK